MVPNTQLLLAINRLPGHRGWPKRQVLDACRDERDLPAAVEEYCRRRPRRRAAVDAAQLLALAEGEERRLRAHAIGLRVLGDAGYPLLLSRIEDPPLVLYCRGEANFDAKPAVALVGTRRPTPRAQRQAFCLGWEIAAADYPVCSGLAFGIDRSVHEGALAAGGVTWAVLAGGLDRPGPKAHRPLAARILDGGGALLGEIPPGVFPSRYAFPRRNRILSGLCRGCVVVQAPRGSGALITAQFALDQNRDVYVADAGMDGPFSEGVRDLEEQGAPVISAGGDVMLDWGRHCNIRHLRVVPEPKGAREMVRMMRQELDGRLYRHMGRCFEYSGA